MKCFQSGCNTSPNFFCTCRKKIEYCCSFHMAYHLGQPGDKKHKFFSTLKNLDASNRVPIIEKLKESISEFKQLKIKVFEISIAFTTLTIECVKKLDEIINYNKRLLKDSISYSQINITVSYNKKYRENNLSLEMLQLNKKEQFKGINFDAFIINVNNFQNLLKNTQEKFVKPYNDTFLYYFIDNTKCLVKFNTKIYSHFKKKINDIQRVGRRASVYCLNDGNIFCYGGGHEKSISSTFYVNQNTFTVTRLPNGKSRHSARPVILRDRIYVFGGWSDKCLNSADYFDIKAEKWTEVAQLPSPQSDTSSIKIKSEIIITGCYNFFQSYSVDLNQYKDLKSGIKINSNNILLKNKDFIFVLCKKIYYCKKTKLKNWISHPCKTLSFDMNSSIPVIRDNKAYFIDEDYRIFMFNFDDLSFIIIGKGKI